MKQLLVSIIIPIYKVEAYLRRCLDSVVSQTYTNLEIILVDDESPDGCPQICDEYASKDNRIIVIHKENGGLSDARNAGLDICRGQYISFVDSDDWISNHYIEKLLTAVETVKADIAVASCKYISDNPLYSERTFPMDSGEINYDDILREIFGRQNPSFVAACIKLFNRNLISQFRFSKGKIHEDEYLNYQWFYKAKKTVYEPNSVYYYFLHADSITGKQSKYEKIEILNQQYSFFNQKGISLPLQWLLPSLCWEYLWEYGNAALRHETTAVDNLLYFRHFTALAIKEKKVPKHSKIFFLVCSRFPFIYLFYRRFSPFKIRK